MELNVDAETKQKLANEAISILSSVPILNIKAVEEKCFECIQSGNKLSGSEKVCLAKCTDRYMQAFSIVNATVVQVQKQLQEAIGRTEPAEGINIPENAEKDEKQFD